MSEYGCSGSVYQHENPIMAQPTPSSPWHPEEYETYHHRVQYSILKDMPECWGVYMWMMFDAAADQRDEGDQPGVNDKGLVTRDRRTRKDAFYFYKANWNPEPMLHLVGARRTHTTNAVNSVFAFCNAGRVSLSVNGAPVGEREPDDRKAVIWDGVRLAPGTNVIEVRSGPLSASCRLRLD